MAVLGWLWFAAVAALAVTVAVTDWRRRLVANGLVVALTVLAAVFVAVGDSDAAVTSRWWAAATAVAAFAVGFGLYASGLIGAGDVKLVLPVALIMTRLGAMAWLFYLGVLIAAAVVVLTVFARRNRSLPLAPVLGLGLIPALLAAPPPWFAL
jgi:prepilin peptidase CpaA